MITRLVTAGERSASAGGDGAHGGYQLLWRVVLEDEPARAGFERFVHVFVEVEGREDQDSCGAIGREDASCRLEPVGLGHADVHQDDGRAEPPRLVGRNRLAWSMAS